MKKITTLIVTFLLIGTSYSQNGKIIKKKQIELSKTPIWNRISKNDSLKPKFKYLNEITFSFIKYKVDSLNVNGYIIEPKKKGKYPVIIYNRGGNRKDGSMNVAKMIYKLSNLVSKGYVVIGSNYREKDEFGGKDINDVLSLTETVKEIENADYKNIGMYGWSRGGMMTYLALKKSNKIKTAIIGNGVTDQFIHIKNRPIMETKVLSECVPNYWENKKEELTKRSSLFWVDKLNNESSLLILCGTNDKRVNPIHSREIAKKLKNIKYDFEFKEYDTDHSFRNKKLELDETVIKWFNKKLKNNS